MSGDFASAARHYRDAGDHGSLGRCLRHLGDSHGAAAAYASAGLRLEAARDLDRAGQASAAAVAYQLAGRYLDAARRFEDSGDLDQASDCYRAAGCTDDALRCDAQICERKGDYAGAARLYQQAAGSAWWAGTAAEMSQRAAACRMLSDQRHAPGELAPTDRVALPDELGTAPRDG